MNTLDAVLPTPRMLETDDVELAAPATEVWRRLRHEDLARAPLVRALFWMRTLPGRIGGGPPVDTSLRLDALRSTPEHPGFSILAEREGEEVVAGAIGKVWQVDIPFVHVDGPQAYAAFSAEGYVKVAWALRVVPQGEQSCRVEVEVRVDATDEASWRKFRRYWRIIGPGSHAIRRALLAGLSRDLGTPDPPTPPARDDLRDVLEGIGGAARIVLALLAPFRRSSRAHWGLDAAAAAREFPGDARIDDPLWGWTHGVEIEASARDVWPWIAQIGADRAGFYSYQWLENLAGCELRNADAVHPEWELRRGDVVSLHPSMPPLPVVALERERYLLLYGADEQARAEGRPWVAVTWLFMVEPLAAARCRVVSRFRAACSDDLRTRLAMGPTIVEPVGFAMDRRMLLGIKQRSEAQRSPK